MKAHPDIEGFQGEAEKTADGSIYEGRLTLHDVQWADTGTELQARTTLSVAQVCGAIENRLVWTDQHVQRGIKPEVFPQPPSQLPVADGYPDPTLYVFHADKSDDMAEKLLEGKKLHLSPLVWNLRPGTFRACWDADLRRIYIYDGRIYLPDSHHRHQAILKAYTVFREAPAEYPNFTPKNQFTVDLYFMTKADEGEFFHEKNILPKPTEKSKAYDLTTRDPLSLLAKEVISRSPSLTGNVNRVTDRLSGSNPHVITLSTLRGMVEAFVEEPELTEQEIVERATEAATFYELLATVRPELGLLPLEQRKRIRSQLLSDSAVMMHGYAALMRAFREDVASSGLEAARKEWADRLYILSADEEFARDGFRGDYFDRANPIWHENGVIQKTKSGKDTLSNTRQTRATCAKLLRSRVLGNEESDG